jgi:apolipoprotein N-acyltransferase
MIANGHWPRTLVIIGLAAMVLGALDPLEGSIVVLVGATLAALGASLSHSRHAVLLLWSFALLFFGVGSMWVLSFFGGVGGSSNNSWWWLIAVVPYPIGWVLGLVGAVRRLREDRRPSAA